MHRLIREPLLHFILIGATLFAFYLLFNPSSLESDRRIVVDTARIEKLAANFRKTWQRPPSREELKELVDSFVLEEVLYRQALALGIDRNDTAIRRRLRQKMEFYTDELIDQSPPTREELQRFMTEHADRYRQPATFRFGQVFLRPDRPRGDVEVRSRQVLADLKAGRFVQSESTMIPEGFDAISGFELDRSFGAGFAHELAKAPLNQWSGPIRSDLGLHFVRLSEFKPAPKPNLEDVASAVERDWRHARTDALKQSFHRKLLEDYEVIVRWDEATDHSS